MWNRSELEVRPKRIRSHRNETEVNLKWNRCGIQLRSKWDQNEFEMRPKWNRSGVDVDPIRCEIDMISNWNRCETDVSPPHNLPYQSAGCGLAGWLAKANTNRGPIIGSAWYFYITCFDQMGKVRRHATALLGRSVPRYDCGAIAVTKIANLLHNIWYIYISLYIHMYKNCNIYYIYIIKSYMTYSMHHVYLNIIVVLIGVEWGRAHVG